MQYKKPRKKDAIQITFGERTESRKLEKVSDLKKTALGRSITRRVKSQKLPPDKMVLRIEGGYAKSTVRRKAREGLAADPYFYVAIPSEPEEPVTPDNAMKFVKDAMEQFDANFGDYTETYDLKGNARIRKVQIDFIHYKGEKVLTGGPLA